MNRRALFRVISALPLLAPALAFATRQPPPAPVLLQESPLAGFQYHNGPAVWDRLQPGDPLGLVREPENAYDRRAVAVYWRGSKLGYLPRVENAAVAQMLDRQLRVAATINRMEKSDDPWKRVQVSVFLV